MEVRLNGARLRGDTGTIGWTPTGRRAKQAGTGDDQTFALTGRAVEVALPPTWDATGWIRVAPPAPPEGSPTADAPGILMLPPGSATGGTRRSLAAWAADARAAGFDVRTVDAGSGEPVTDPERLHGDKPSILRRTPTWVITGLILIGLFMIGSWILGVFYAGDIQAASGFPVSVDGHNQDEALVATYFERFDEIARGAAWIGDIERAMVRAASNDVTIYTTLNDRDGLEVAREICYVALEAGADDVHVWGDKIFTDTKLDGTTATETVNTEIVESTLGVCQKS